MNNPFFHHPISFMAKTSLFLLCVVIHLHCYTQEVKQPVSIHDALADTSSFVVPEISTRQLKQVMASGSALLLDTRPFEEWARGHLPGALNVAPKAGMEMSLYTSDVDEILRLARGDKNKALVLYCNGPFCDKSKRLSADLVLEGFTNVLRYQVGIPVWQATGNVLQVELPALTYFNKDKTVVWIDARDESLFNNGSVKGAINIPFNKLTGHKNTGIIKQAKDDGRLPMLDHNTRIIVLADNVQDALAVSEAIAKEAFHNVYYFNGNVQEALKAIND
jgi:rhodanese-related sulfurtransferase